jgi:hypothetical protein
VHGIGVYFAGVGPKGPALERFLDIKKKKKNELKSFNTLYLWTIVSVFLNLLSFHSFVVLFPHSN